MKISAVEFDVQKDKYKNLEIINNFAEKISIKEKSDLIILPELSANGYLFENRTELEKTAENIEDGIFLNNLAKISKENNVAIIGGFTEKFENNIYAPYNRRREEAIERGMIPREVMSSPESSRRPEDDLRMFIDRGFIPKDESAAGEVVSVPAASDSDATANEGVPEAAGEQSN